MGKDTTQLQIRQNSAELAVSLLCHGIRLDESCTREQERTLKRRAGLGSGIELIIPGDKKKIWVNVPIKEHFASHSPYVLVKRGEQYQIESYCLEPWPVIIPPVPQWYSRKTSSGLTMSKIGILQGTSLGIYVGEMCNFWTMEPRMACKFCATGLNVGVHEAKTKTIQDVVETAVAARKESGVTFVHLNSGYQKGRDVTQIVPFVKAIKQEVGSLVGVQTIPAADIHEYDMLIKMGVDHFSFCYEFHNPDYFEQYLPGKARYIGQNRFFQALEYVAKKMPKGSVSGEIIAGIEPVESTMKAISYITSLGAFPTVCIFRPLGGTALEEYPSPSEEDMLKVLRYVGTACLKERIPVGIAPNLEVSIIMTPDDCRYLLPRNFSWYFTHYKLALMKFLAYPYFAIKRNRFFMRFSYFLKKL